MAATADRLIRDSSIPSHVETRPPAVRELAMILPELATELADARRECRD